MVSELFIYPHQNLIPNHLEFLNRLIDKDSNSFDFIFLNIDFIFIGDIDLSTKHNWMVNCNDLMGLRNLINVLTCYKSFDIPTSIDLILKNHPN